MKRQKALYISLTVIITIGFVLLGYFVFANSYLRLKEAFIDLYGSIKYYFCSLFNLPTDGIPAPSASTSSACTALWAAA